MKLLRRSDLAIIALAAVLFSTWLGLNTDKSPSYSETQDLVQIPQVSRPNSTTDPATSPVSAKGESIKTESTKNVSKTTKDFAEAPTEVDYTQIQPQLVAAAKDLQGIKVKQADADRIPPGISDPRTLRRFGRGAPFDLGDLPNGNLKTQITNLSPKAKKKAMAWLHTFNFSGIDAVDSLNADNNGGIYYSCYKGQCGHTGCQAGGTPHNHDTEAIKAADVESAKEPGVSAAAVPISAPPIYNSKPGSEFTMYLDFNGAVIEGKAWNSSYGVASWTAKAYSSDGDLTTFSDTEQTFMRRVWERIAEDYAPFDINVTTDVAFDPDTYTGDKNKVAWNLFCPRVDANSVNLPHAGSGGIAYVGVFGNSNFFSSYQPAFTKAETNESPSNAAEAGSHEIGHNMGLSHDTRSDEGYYGGHTGAGAPTWGPIMGTGYGRNLSQWSKGEYYDSKHASWNGSSYDNNANTNDDLLIISNRTAYRIDDHGDTNGTATELSLGSGGGINQTGIISETSEVDVFSFSTGAGSITINADTFRSDSSTWGGNLDINLELYDAGGSLVASNNPATDVNTTITTTVAAGTYYVHIKPSAAGNASGTGSPYDPTTSTRAGYTVYASLGQYTVTGTAVVPGVGIAETGTTDVTEGGATDTYSIVLGTQPTASVTVNISPDSQVTTNKASVTFTTVDWNTPQVVTVTSVDDSLEEGAHTGTITHTSSSTDSNFNGIGVGSVIANITDNDNILVTSPNGGDSWFTNVTQTIQWSSLLGGNVKIELLKGGLLDTTIVSSTLNDGSHQWAVPLSLTPASDYKIRITSVESPTVMDESDANFTFVEGPIYFHDFETDPGYTKTGLWEWGSPAGNNRASSAYSGTKMYDTDLDNTCWTGGSLTSTPINCSLYTSVALEFYADVLIYSPDFGIRFEVSNDNSTWTTLFQQTGMNASWSKYTYDISSVADGQSTVYVRWTLVGNGGTQYTGGGIALDDIKLTGTYTSGDPELDVSRGGAIADGGSDSVPGTSTGQGTQLTYTMANTGAGSLNLQNAIDSAASNCSVIIDTQPASTVSPSNSSNLVVTVTPTVPGPWSFNLSVGNNDPNENPYDWSVSGTAVTPVPEIDISRSGAIADGGTDSVSPSSSGQGTPLSYTIANSGTSSLTVSNAVKSSENNCSVVINTQPASSVAAGNSTGLVVTVTPTAGGAWSFNLSVDNNDSNENPYNWSVSGTAVTETTTPFTASEDTYISNDNTTTNYGSDTILQLNSHGNSTKQGLVKFDLSSIPTDATITSATLTLTAGGGSYTGAVQVCNVSGAWTGGGATYANSSGIVGATDYGSATMSASTLGTALPINLNTGGITLIQDWVTNPTSNNGFSLKTDYAANQAARFVQICSSEHATAGYHPKLTVTYTSTPLPKFDLWAGGTTTFTADTNQDGVSDGIAWLLGANQPTTNAQSLLPTANSGDGTDLVMTFNCLNAANRGSSVCSIQYSQDLGATDLWSSNTVVVPEESSTVGGVAFVITPNGNINEVQATIPAGTSNLFGRVMGTE